MKIVAITPELFEPAERLSKLDSVDVVRASSLAELRGRVSDAEAILLAPRYGSLLAELWLEMKSVRWIHSLGAGVDTLPFDLLQRTEIVVTNSRGLYAEALGEFAIAAMLWFAKDLQRLARNQAARRWEPFDVEMLQGKSVGIAGYGGTGHAVGRRAEALGMKIHPVRRHQEPGETPLDEVVRISDYLVLCPPLTPATRGLISRSRLEMMPASSVLINVSRGAVVDQPALVEILRRRRIRGAALDVFETEPLPSTDPLWNLDNVLLSPHSADHTSDAHDRAMSFFLENLGRYRRGEPLENVVDKLEQY